MINRILVMNQGTVTEIARSSGLIKIEGEIFTGMLKQRLEHM